MLYIERERRCNYALAVFIVLVAILLVACTGRGDNNTAAPEMQPANPLVSAGDAKLTDTVDGGGWGGDPPVGPLGGGIPEGGG